MKSFEVNFGTLMLRFYLMMAIIIISFSIGLPWLAFLAFPVFMSCLMGVKFEWKRIFETVANRLGSVRTISAKRNLAEVG